MININLADGCFMHIQASNLNGDCAGELPLHIRWNRLMNSPGPLFLTDMHIPQVERYMDYEYRIGWLLEPPSLSDTHYRMAVHLQDKFYKILTFDQELISRYPDKFIYYPFGGSWIGLCDWKIYDKSKSASMIASHKQKAEGHRLRHAIARFISYATIMDVDIMGSGYQPIESKLTGLADYRYSIVVESCITDDYFSEKLIDCLSCGTIPIYWGCKNIGKYFNKNGIIPFATITELENILIQVISEYDYQSRLDAIKENYKTAMQYRVAEDWMFDHYPFLFAGCKAI